MTCADFPLFIVFSPVPTIDSVDGLVLMSSLTLVLDGVLIEPPPTVLPLSATAHTGSLASGSLFGNSMMMAMSTSEGTPGD